MDIELKSLTCDELRPVVEAVFESCEGTYQIHGKLSSSVFTQAWVRFIHKGVGKVNAVFKSGEPIGLMAFFTPSPCLLTGVVQSVPYLTLVSPQHRKTGAGSCLLDSFEKESIAAGAEMLIQGRLEDSLPAELEQWYLNSGYRPYAKSFSKMVGDK